MRGWKLWTALFHITLFVLIGERGWAVPPLTIIQDTLYKADGTRFNGVVYIEWKSFTASDSTTIGAQSLTLAIVNGDLRVRLVPTTTASSGAYYSVRYHADGRIQFSEYWNVPPSATPVGLAAVRSAVTGGGGTGGTGGDPSNLEITDVVGLADALAERPVMGFSYAPNRTVRTGSTGALEAVTGNLTDCVRVDGSSTPCGTGGGGGSGSSPTFVDLETPSGTIDGTNTVFALSQSPSPASSLSLFRNGLRMTPGIDYQLNANSITMLTASTPRAGDQLTASYRVGATAGGLEMPPAGVLTGSWDNPQLAEGAVSNFNVAPAAGIVESKLSLNYATHSNANDPTAGQKAALGGTAGTPSATNKYVTNDDSRMQNARAALAHPLLGAGHSDTAAGTAARGDLITGQGTTAAWTRLPLGLAGRCLMSNGVDAIWNTCLYTGFNAGAVPFVDANGNLSQNTLQLRWDVSNRRLSVGSGLAESTLNVQDTSGVTAVQVRAGAGQGSQPLARWQDAAGNDLATVGSDGALSAASARTRSSAAAAGWRDDGTVADPSAPADGDSWYHTGVKARRSRAGGQTHTAPQVLCSKTGTATSLGAAEVIGSCAIPAGLLQPGDRLEVSVDAGRGGSPSGWTVTVKWGAAVLHTRTLTGSDALFNLRSQLAVTGTTAVASSLSMNGAGTLAAGMGVLAEPYAAGLALTVTGSFDTPGATAVEATGLTVVRYPAQSN